MARMPALFVCHGAPHLAVDKSQANAFLKTLAATLPRPRAILVASAHHETDVPTLSTAERHETIHDFRGFPPELYQIAYPAPGAPDVARDAQARLSAAGIAATASSRGGLDHGAWVPLSLIFA
ncbi:MAG: dioxygenase family protein, partial [Methyloligellaceae bacterium]